MRLQPHVTFTARLARRPLPVLLGALVGFLSCCLAGRVAARQQPFENFVRFHPGISTEVNFYPTFSQVLNLARRHVEPGKVLVVVGGNSIFHGTGQRASHIWTRHLQELLGERYVVLNLALRGTDPFEFGGLVAEKLASEGVPVVYVTVALDGNMDVCGVGEWEGRFNQYFFWDAWGKGLLPPDERRDQWLGDETSWKPYFGTNRRELRYRAMVDGVVYAGDLWNAVAFRYHSTVYTPVERMKFLGAFRQMPDLDPGSSIPPEYYNREAEVPAHLKVIQYWIHSAVAELLLKGEGDDILAKRYRQFVPTALQQRSLFVFRYESPFYRDRLSPEDRKHYEGVIRRLPQVLDGEDFQVQLVGENYTKEDYIDRTHFSEQGGRKVASDLAPSIRSIAAKLYGASETNLQGGKP
jgi:hypothetical protein